MSKKHRLFALMNPKGKVVYISSKRWQCDYERPVRFENGQWTIRTWKIRRLHPTEVAEVKK